MKRINTEQVTGIGVTTDRHIITREYFRHATILFIGKYVLF